MGHLVAISQLVYCCCRISAADDGGGVCLCQSLGNCLCAVCKVWHLERSHGAVPYNGLGVLHSVAEDLLCLRSDIQAFPVLRDLACFYHALIGIVGEIVRDHGVNGKQKLHALLLSFFQHVQRIFAVIFLKKRFAYASALRLAEGIGHTAADDQGVYFIKQVLDHRDLAGNFSSAQDSYKRTLRIVHCISQEIDLLLHQISYYSGIYILGNAYVGAMRSVRGSKGVVYKYIAQGSQLFAELLAVLGLLRTVTGVLKKDHIAVFHGFYRCLCVWSHNFRISGKFYFLAQKLGQAYCHRRQGKFRNRLSLGLAKMRTKDNLSSICDQLLDGGKSCYQTVLVSDLSIDQRYVEIASYQDFLSFYINIVYRFFIKHKSASSIFIISSRKGSGP